MRIIDPQDTEGYKTHINKQARHGIINADIIALAMGGDCAARPTLDDIESLGKSIYDSFAKLYPNFSPWQDQYLAELLGSISNGYISDKWSRILNIIGRESDAGEIVDLFFCKLPKVGTTLEKVMQVMPARSAEQSAICLKVARAFGVKEVICELDYYGLHLDGYFIKSDDGSMWNLSDNRNYLTPTFKHTVGCGENELGTFCESVTMSGYRLHAQSTNNTNLITLTLDAPGSIRFRHEVKQRVETLVSQGIPVWFEDVQEMEQKERGYLDEAEMREIELFDIEEKLSVG
jgi:hypothetical protein